jgi:hypothetical protein
MPGYVYYIIVSIFGLALAILIISKSKDYLKLTIFFFFSAVVADFGEVLVMIVLKSYSYKPGLFANAYRENIFGHILPNSTLWPATAVLVAAYSLRKGWLIVISLIYMALDILFLHLGIYEHHWWRTWMTGVAIFLYCILAQFWYKKLDDPRYAILKFISFSFTLLVFTFLPLIPLLLTNRQFYSIGICKDNYRDSIIFSFTYHLIITPICTLLMLKFDKWYLILTQFLIFITCECIFKAIGILRFANGWNIYGFIIVLVICICICNVLIRYYNNNAKFNNMKFFGND